MFNSVACMSVYIIISETSNKCVRDKAGGVGWWGCGVKDKICSLAGENDTKMKVERVSQKKERLKG